MPCRHRTVGMEVHRGTRFVRRGGKAVQGHTEFVLVFYIRFTGTPVRGCASRLHGFADVCEDIPCAGAKGWVTWCTGCQESGPGCSSSHHGTQKRIKPHQTAVLLRHQVTLPSQKFTFIGPNTVGNTPELPGGSLQVTALARGPQLRRTPQPISGQ